MIVIFMAGAALALSAGSVFALAPGGVCSKDNCASISASSLPDCTCRSEAVAASAPRPKCEKTVVVTGMHYPDLTCAQSKADFMDGMMTSYHFTSKCAPAELLAVYKVSCQDAPVSGFSSGSVYKGTACCGNALSPKPCYRITTPEACAVATCKETGEKCIFTAAGKCACAPKPAVTKCIKNAAVTGLYDPDATTCALRMANFKSQIETQIEAWDKPGVFSSLCLPAMRLLSVVDITCVPAPLTKYAGGSLYGGTVCCGTK